MLLLFFSIFVTLLVIELLELSFEYTEMKRENEKVKLEIKAAEAVGTELESIIGKLNDPDYLKSYAKENYLYSEDGTIIIRVPEDEEEDE